jgi:hypothetical protein
MVTEVPADVGPSVGLMLVTAGTEPGVTDVLFDEAV